MTDGDHAVPAFGCRLCDGLDARPPDVIRVVGQAQRLYGTGVGVSEPDGLRGIADAVHFCTQEARHNARAEVHPPPGEGIAIVVGGFDERGVAVHDRLCRQIHWVVAQVAVGWTVGERVGGSEIDQGTLKLPGPPG
jgi:hypothetical protein